MISSRNLPIAPAYSATAMVERAHSSSAKAAAETTTSRVLGFVPAVGSHGTVNIAKRKVSAFKTTRLLAVADQDRHGWRHPTERLYLDESGTACGSLSTREQILISTSLSMTRMSHCQSVPTLRDANFENGAVGFKSQKAKAALVLQTRSYKPAKVATVVAGGELHMRLESLRKKSELGTRSTRLDKYSTILNLPIRPTRGSPAQRPHKNQAKKLDPHALSKNLEHDECSPQTTNRLRLTQNRLRQLLLPCLSPTAPVDLLRLVAPPQAFFNLY